MITGDSVGKHYVPSNRKKWKICTQRQEDMKRAEKRRILAWRHNDHLDITILQRVQLKVVIVVNVQLAHVHIINISMSTNNKGQN